jgi:peroxiredoxin Q/BCP
MIAGERAPDFTLYDHTGRPRTLSALLSDGPVVLFFFPIASSPICTAQACHFRDLSDEFARVRAQRVGISTNTVDKQAHFARQRSFDYPLLSDEDDVVSELFGVRRGRLAQLRGSVGAREPARSDGPRSSSTPTAPFSRSSPARCAHRCTPTRRCGF